MAATATNAEKHVENKQDSSDSQEMGDFKDIYYAELTKCYDSQTKPTVIKPWTRQKILEVIQQIKNAKVTMQSSAHRTPPKTYWHIRYDVLKIGDEEFLTVKKESSNCPTIRVVPSEEYYDILIKVHKDCGHGGCNKIYNIIKDSYIIARRAVELFVLLCPICQSKSNMPKKGIGDCNTLPNHSITRGKIDLIDMQLVPDGQFKWILNYQDLSTKFVHLRPLCSKEASEVAFELLKIFLEFGVPCTLQSASGIEFAANIIKEIEQLWPECTIIDCVHNPQTQDSDECSDENVENMIWTWMRNNTSAEWVTGCFFVQYVKNKLFHTVLGRSPFQALFRSESNFLEQTLNPQDTYRLELPETLSSTVNKSPSPSHQKAQKRKITSQDSDVPKTSENTAAIEPPTTQNAEKSMVETESSELPQTVSSPPSCQKPKKQKTTDTPRLETETSELIQTSRSSVNTISSSTQNAINDPPPCSQDTDTSPSIESEHPELSRPVSSPVYIVPPSPPYQYGSSNSPAYTFPASPSFQNANHDPPNGCPEMPQNKFSSAYNAPSPTYTPSSSHNTLSLPANKPTTPVYVTCSPTCKPSSPQYTSSTPIYQPSSPAYMPSSPQYTSSSPANKQTTPVYVPCSPTYNPSSPRYTSRTPIYRPLSPGYRPSSPQHITPSSPSYQNEKIDCNKGVEKILQFLEKRFPTSDIDYLFMHYAETFKRFPLKIQCELKVQLVKMFANVEIEMLQNSMPINNGTQTQMDADCSNR